MHSEATSWHLALSALSPSDLLAHWSYDEAARIAVTKVYATSRSGVGASLMKLLQPSQPRYVWVRGKGNPEGLHVAPVTPGRMLFEVEGVSYEIAKGHFVWLPEATSDHKVCGSP